MSDIALKHYEISLWDDVLTWAWKEPNSEEWTIDTNPPEEVGSSTIVKQFFDEVKLCIIGSDQMVSYAKANNPVFTENTNGQKTLTFSLVARYFDEDLQDYVQNPFINLLVNERKVKLYYNDEWFDLIIKNIQENKGSNSYSYTAQSAAINELSKTGFNLEFDTELQNNMGTVTDLAAKVVEGTDWVIDVNNSDVLTQYVEEPVYSFTTTNCSAVDTLTGNSVTLPNTAYVFYSQLQPQNDGSYLNPFQAINPTTQGNNPLLNDDRILVKENGDYAQNITVTATEVPVQAELTDYRGMRLNRHQSAVFDSKLNRYVNVYSTNIAGVNTVYGYTETKYISPVIVQDFVTNGIDFTSTGGWACNGNDSLRLGFEKEPVTNAYLDFKPNTASNWLYNSGIYDMRSQIHEFTADTSYIMRIDSNIISFTDNASTDFTAVVAPYSLTNGAYNVTTNEAILTFSNWTRDNGYTSIVTPDVWDANISYYTQANTGEYTQVNTQEQTTPQAGTQYYIQNKTYAKAVASCQYSLSYQDLLRSTPGLFIKANNKPDWKLYELQFYQQVTVNGRDLVPGDPPTQDILEFVPRYYNPEQEYEKADDLEFLSNDATYTPVYDDNYEKIRSIVIKESNRYNIIQTLCETFECWARFNIAHDSTGKIILDANLVPTKSISFHEYIGDDNYAGFRYQVNLKDIQRTLVSDQLVTKIVVKANSNEFAPHGFCTIARAQENPTKENFLLDFIHYIRHGLLSNTELTNDLYLEQNGYIGYYKKLAEYNRERDEKIELLTQLQTTQNQLTAALQVAELASASAEKLLNDAIGDWRRFKGTEYVEYNPSEASEMGQKIQTTIEVQRKAAENWSARAFSLDLQSKDNQEKIDDIKHYLYEETDEEDTNETLLSKKKALDAEFYKKYSRFIQEGSWISEDYVDDNLYFIDAQNTLRTSAEPQVTYSISVMALDALDEYKSYNFKIGDKTYVEDEEFFGYVPGAPVQTPYHEEVIVSQVQWSLDNPANNNITVQNFKTRFQDLFQRITAQTQSLQYNNGAYQKAAMVVTTDGAITESALGKALIDSTLVLSNAQDQSVVIDNSGITITDLTNYREIVRLVSGGILLSNDGGQSWSNAITGDGINANYITAGQIDTAIIRVGSGAWPSFRWDSNGLAAYAFDTDEHGNPQNFLFNKLVRFDQYGLYGYIGQSDFVPASLSDVINNAQFSLTWDGFQIKSNNGGGYIRISSNDDIQVYDNAHERIKIGRISADNAVPTIYGIKISNDDGAPVLVTDSNGNLWLENLLKVGDGTNSSVSIGYNTSDDEDDTYEGAHEVINANDTFIVYENGHIKATSAEVEGTIIATDGIFRGTVYAEDGSFNGRIYATGGQIGGLSLDSIVSLGDAAMIFDANGLTVKNSNFRIQRTSGDEEPVDLLYFDTDDQVLKIIGNGVFTGTIHATEGDFIGTITATNGNIKYLKIGDEPYLELGEVYDENNNLVFQGIRSNNQAFSIDTNGSVVANDIHLGTGAVIEQFIELGTAKILNPASNKDGTILQAGNVKLNQDGTGVIGDLQFNGETSTLSGEKWFITPDLASFSNVYVEGEISTSVFTANETRASGGSMIFKTGSIIQEIVVDNGISTLTLTQKEISAFEEGDYIIITKDGDGLKNSVVARVQELNLDTYKITVPVEVSTEANLLINLGQVANNIFNDWLIGVNSTDNPISKIGLHQNALSMNQLSLENGEVRFEEQVVLGDLTGLKYGFDDNSLEGSGLYAQNVYLTGALATQYKLEYIPVLAASEVPTFELDTYYKKVGDDYILLETEPDDWETNYTNYYIKDEIQYAGVSTYFNDSSVPFAKSTELANVGLKGDTSPIVFWAGATGLDKIQEAPFQVTSNGTLYAQQGYFEGSILTKATIEASELIAPLITGKATGEDNWLLTLKTERVNSNFGLQGFRFIGLDNDSNTIEFTTITSQKAHFNNDIQLNNSNSISFDDESFVKITNEDIEAKTYLVKNAIDSETNTQLGLLINGSQIAFQQQQSNLGSWDELGRIDYIVDTFYVYNGGTKEIEITKTGFASKEQTYLDKDVYMGIAGSSNALFYKNNTEGEGYDLYVGSAR